MKVELDGEKIFGWRYWEGVSAENAAQRAGVSVSTFLRAENDKGAVTPQTARKIAALLGVDTAELER